MKKPPAKGGRASHGSASDSGKVANKVERRRFPRRRHAAKQQVVAIAPEASQRCRHCGHDLRGEEKSLFVEEEICRLFCSETCITDFFSEDISRMEKFYLKHLPPDDLSTNERDSLAHLRWITLQEPDEIWRVKTPAGDYRYTLISQFEPGAKRVWCVCTCLFLRGEPSFLFFSFQSAKEGLIQLYRRGERMSLMQEEVGEDGEEVAETEKSDRLAENWTPDETVLAQLKVERSKDDIAPEDFHLYSECLDETLEKPDEVWTIPAGSEEKAARIFQLIRFFPQEDPQIGYIVVARDSAEPGHIEIMDAFPTKDSKVVEHYRRGQNDLPSTEEADADESDEASGVSSTAVAKKRVIH